MKRHLKAIFEGLENEHAGKKPGAPAHVDYEKALTYLKWLIQLELFGTIDTERTPKKQEIKPGIDL